MTDPTPTAWFCPACQAHHAPHVSTCPRAAVPAPVYLPNPLTPSMPHGPAPCTPWGPYLPSTGVGVGIAACDDPNLWYRNGTAH